MYQSTHHEQSTARHFYTGTASTRLGNIKITYLSAVLGRHEAYTKCVLRDSLSFDIQSAAKRVNSIPAAAFNWYLWAPKTIPAQLCWETRFDFSLYGVYTGCWINWTRNLRGESKCDAYCGAGRKWSALRGHLNVYARKFHQGIENASLDPQLNEFIIASAWKIVLFWLMHMVS
jgi:hypothetical protein